MVEKVVDDIKKIDDVDGCIIEDIAFHEELDKDTSGQNDGAASEDSRENGGGRASELPTDNEEGIPVLKRVDYVTYV